MEVSHVDELENNENIKHKKTHCKLVQHAAINGPQFAHTFLYLCS